MQTTITLSDKSTFLVNHWSKRLAFSRLPFFGKTIGVPFSTLLSEGEDGFFQNVPDALALLFSYLEESTVDRVLDTLLDSVYAYEQGKANPVPIDIDKHCNDLGSIIELCSKVFMIHYGSLFRKEVFGDMMKMGQGISALQS